jgi:hypothetical protein
MALDFGLCTLAYNLALLFSMFRGLVPDRPEQQGREAHDYEDSVTGGWLGHLGLKILNILIMP